MATAEYELLVEVRDAIKNDSTLATICGQTPKTYLYQAPDNTKYPYFLYNLGKKKTKDNVIFSGCLNIEVWFLLSDKANAEQAVDRVFEIFNNTITSGPTNLKSCRFWHEEENRVRVYKKDNSTPYDLICIEVEFACRWISVNRTNASGT